VAGQRCSVSLLEGSPAPGRLKWRMKAGSSGSMIDTWRGRAQSGVLMKQDRHPSGDPHQRELCIWRSGWTGNGGRFAAQGLYCYRSGTDSGMGRWALSAQISTMLVLVSGNVTVGSGTYTMAANGRGTGDTTLPQTW